MRYTDSSTDQGVQLEYLQPRPRSQFYISFCGSWKAILSFSAWSVKTDIDRCIRDQSTIIPGRVVWLLVDRQGPETENQNCMNDRQFVYWANQM